MSKPIPPDRDIDPICVELRQDRIEANLTQPKVAAELGFTSQSPVSSYETGDGSPRLDVLHAWAAIFGKRVVLVQDDTPVKAGRRSRNESAADLVSVQLEPYEMALAMGMLLTVVNDYRHSGKSQRVADDLEAVADKLAQGHGAPVVHETARPRPAAGRTCILPTWQDGGLLGVGGGPAAPDRRSIWKRRRSSSSGTATSRAGGPPS